MMNSEHHTGAMVTTTMTGMSTINTSIMSDAMSDDDDPSSPESHSFDETDMLHHHMQDDVTAQLAASGVILLNIVVEIYHVQC